MILIIFRNLILAEIYNFFPCDFLIQIFMDKFFSGSKSPMCVPCFPNNISTTTTTATRTTTTTTKVQVPTTIRTDMIIVAGIFLSFLLRIAKYFYLKLKSISKMELITDLYKFWLRTKNHLFATKSYLNVNQKESLTQCFNLKMKCESELIKI